jgi:hypothetical protein
LQEYNTTEKTTATAQITNTSIENNRQFPVLSFNNNLSKAKETTVAITGRM